MEAEQGKEFPAGLALTFGEPHLPHYEKHLANDVSIMKMSPEIMFIPRHLTT